MRRTSSCFCARCACHGDARAAWPAAARQLATRPQGSAASSAFWTRCWMRLLAPCARAPLRVRRLRGPAPCATPAALEHSERGLCVQRRELLPAVRANASLRELEASALSDERYAREAEALVAARTTQLLNNEINELTGRLAAIHACTAHRSASRSGCLALWVLCWRSAWKMLAHASLVVPRRLNNSSACTVQPLSNTPRASLSTAAARLHPRHLQGRSWENGIHCSVGRSVSVVFAQLCSSLARAHPSPSAHTHARHARCSRAAARHGRQRCGARANGVARGALGARRERGALGGAAHRRARAARPGIWPQPAQRAAALGGPCAAALASARLWRS
jgi:hypothetical protein